MSINYNSHDSVIISKLSSHLVIIILWTGVCCAATFILSEQNEECSYL